MLNEQHTFENSTHFELFFDYTHRPSLSWQDQISESVIVPTASGKNFRLHYCLNANWTVKYQHQHFRILRMLLLYK